MQTFGMSAPMKVVAEQFSSTTGGRDAVGMGATH
jgi:hypothetical protein